MTTAYAADTVTVGSSFTTNYYYRASNRVWVELDTQQHYVNETGYVAYCLQMEKSSPHNSGYTKVNGLDYYDQTTVNGLAAILENGYPNNNGAFTDDQARYATANAIRFWIAERGGDGMMGWLDYNKYYDLFLPKKGYEPLFDWSVSLLRQAENQNVSAKAITFSAHDMLLTEDEDIFVGTVTVTTNCNGGYELNTAELPKDAVITGYTGKSGDILRICVPCENAETSFTISVIGRDNRTPASLFFYKPDNTSEQRILAYAFDVFSEAASDSMRITTPKVTPRTADCLIQKIDLENGQPLSGAGFRLFSSDGSQIAEGVTDESGSLTFNDLPCGEYTYQEFKAPKGYILDDTLYPLSVTESGVTVTKTQRNSRREGTLQVNKLDPDGSALSGAAFLLEFSADGGSTWAPVFARENGGSVTCGGCTSPGLADGELVSGSDGIAVFTGLRADGKTLYRLTETKAPDGHSLVAGSLYVGTLPVEVDDPNTADSETVGGKTYAYTIYNTVTDCPVFRLPETGGSGFVVLPISMLLTAATIFTIPKRRKTD